MKLFDEIWGIPPYDEHYRREDNYISQELAANDYFKRMRDCEIVLRFFALRQTSKIRGAMRSMLDTCMQEHSNITETDAEEMGNLFKECLEISHQIFGDKTFKIRTPKGKWSLSLPLFDGIMIAIERLRGKRDKLIKERKKIVEVLQLRFANAQSYEVIVGKPNTADAVKSRIALIYNLMRRFA